MSRGSPLASFGFSNFADDRWRLVIAEPAPSCSVKVARIQHGDVGLERGMDGRDGFRVVGVPIAARHAHGTEPHFGNAGTVPSRSNKPHLNPPRIFGRAILSKWSANLSHAM